MNDALCISQSIDAALTPSGDSKGINLSFSPTDDPHDRFRLNIALSIIAYVKVFELWVGSIAFPVSLSRFSPRHYLMSFAAYIHYLFRHLENLLLQYI